MSEQPQRSTDKLDIETRYRRAEALKLAAHNNQPLAFNTTVHPHWIDDSDCFWYRRDSKQANQYRLVNAATGSNDIAFDHEALGRALSLSATETVAATQLPISHVKIMLSPREVRFSAFGKKWIYHDENRTCQAIKSYPDNWALSPDGTKAAFFRNCNLWVHDLVEDKEKQLTHDGERHYVYAGTPSIYGRQEPLTLEALWSPDSRRLYTLVTDARKVKVGTPLVRHVPPVEVGLRPDIIDPDRRAAWMGDDHRELYYFLSIDVNSGERVDAKYSGCELIYPPYSGFFTSSRGWWGPDNRRAYFVDLSNGGRTVKLVEFDTHTGATRVLIEESSDTRINLFQPCHNGCVFKPLPGGKDIAWFSERSGWGKLYLYDLETGALKNPITPTESATAGVHQEWVVRNILYCDMERRELLIQTVGRTPGRNPYLSDICWVNIDTSKLTPVIATEHDYLVCDPVNWFTNNLPSGVSPTGRYLVTTRSRVDQAPVSLLLNRQGDIVLELETADISNLPEGWQWPEPFTFTAADGQTDLYGIVYRPPNFSEQESYPVLDFSSNGDFMHMGSFSNTWDYYDPAVYAELGFIVVIMRSRGTNLRSKAFLDEKDSPLYHSSHQDDCIAGIKQLAKKYPYMDTERVGLGGYSSSASTLTGMLRYPDFYTVGVSINSFVDARLSPIDFSEMACGGQMDSAAMQPYFNLEDSAKNLQGKLYLIHGMLDNCIPVSATFRIIDALQRANKNFDLLLLPNLGHHSSRYVLRRTWDYYVMHLQGVEPPKDLDLSTQFDMEDGTRFAYQSLLESH